ncbi:hypothetical protein MJD09_21020 [bacterium]|nr:hypothetical protein [bacterium]
MENPKARFGGVAVCLMFAGLWSCSSGESGPSFEELIDQGWAAFAQGDYQTAADLFSDAETQNIEDAEANIGRGWSLMQLDRLSESETVFLTGRTKINATADLFAGWAFVLNALKRYSDSNTQAERALSLDASWSFSHGLPLDADDLQLVRAENYFLLGDFSESLVAVLLLNPSFDADVSTVAGQSALAAEIERLKTTSLLRFFTSAS